MTRAIAQPRVEWVREIPEELFERYQGHCSEEDYFRLFADHFIEYTDGVLEVLPMPTMLHALIAKALLYLLDALRDADGRPAGQTLLSVFHLTVREGKHREPDVFFMKRKNFARMANDRWTYTDLAIEIVSKGGANRDYEVKRRDYAEAKVPEYWIVDPLKRCITILILEGDAYRDHAVVNDAQRAVSPTIAGFEVDVKTLLDQPMAR